MNHIVGAGSQNAVNAHLLDPGADRETLMAEVAGHWERHDPRPGAVIGVLADQLRAHDDRAEFLAGIDVILAGLERSRDDVDQGSAPSVPRGSDTT